MPPSMINLPVSINPWQGPTDMSSQMLQLRFCRLSSQDTGARLDSVSHSRPSRWGKPCSRLDHVRRYDQIRGLLRWVSQPFRRHTPNAQIYQYIIDTSDKEPEVEINNYLGIFADIRICIFRLSCVAAELCSISQPANQPRLRYHTGSIKSGCGGGSTVILCE